MNRPLNPREPLKRTADNNWVHVTCAVWTPEIKFGNAKALGPSEGIPLIPQSRYAEVCKVCKRDDGACVSCHHCRASVHVECAHQASYVLGFDITPVKGSRRDQFNIVSLNGESGVMTAAIWCKEHAPKTKAHQMHDMVEESGMNVLQLYVQNFKQADLALTGCARKANQITVASKMSTPVSPPASNRRFSTINAANVVNGDRDASPTALVPGGKVCMTCSTDVSPTWHAIDQTQERELTNGYYGKLGLEAQRFVEQRSFQCHKCKKLNRKPNPHPPQVDEPTTLSEPRQAHPSAIVADRSIGPVDSRHAIRTSYWSPGMPPATGHAGAQPVPLQAPVGGPIAPPMIPPSVQGPPVAPPPLPPTIGPRGPPIQTPQYGPANRPYDWHRPGPVHPSRELNSGPSPPPSGIPPLAPPNHLRPPPLANLQGAHGPPAQNGHMAQPPYVNGVMPPSPRRVTAPPPTQNGGPYIPSHHSHGHGPPDLRPHHMSMGQIPPVVPSPVTPETQQPHNYLRQWNHPPAPPHHAAPHHTSPPPLRESLSMSREPSNPPPPRNATGASASPSLRNLLS